MKRKGQALVEFVIIIPIFILLVLAVIDVGHILYTKIELEGDLSEVISLYQGGANQDNIQDKMHLEKENKILEIKTDNDYVTFDISRELEIMTPGLNVIFKNPYKVNVDRSISNDK